MWILLPHSQRFFFIRSLCCLGIFMFTTFPEWFWCTCVVNSILKTRATWEDSQSYITYTCEFLFVSYPRSNSPLCPINRVLFYLQRSCLVDKMFGERLEVAQRCVLLQRAPSLTQSGLPSLSCEAAWCRAPFPKVLWHINSY